MGNCLRREGKIRLASYSGSVTERDNAATSSPNWQSLEAFYFKAFNRALRRDLYRAAVFL